MASVDSSLEVLEDYLSEPEAVADPLEHLASDPLFRLEASVRLLEENPSEEILFLV